MEDWLAAHPRVTLRLLPTYGPRANPIERALGEVQDLCTRNQTRQRLRDLVADVEEHLCVNGPWKYQRSARSDEPAVTTAVEKLATEAQATKATMVA